MPSIAVADIANGALQLLGAKRLAALTDQTPSARACNLCYNIMRQSELRKHDWNFAIKRASLAADNPAPTWGRQNSFTLPSDFLRLTGSYPELLTNDPNIVGVSVAFTASFTGMKDWLIEGRSVVTNDQAPLNVRYIAGITDTTLWDPIFCEVVSAAMAYRMCEELTQSNTKKTDIGQYYKEQVELAKMTNAIEVAPIDPPPDTWIATRN